MMDFSAYETVIVANGEAPTHPAALALLRHARHIVCCDGAIRHLLALKLTPSAIVGDGDSIQNTEYQRFRHLFIEDKSTEYNDLTKAFNYCAAQNWHRVAVVGACGLREDHALANIALLMLHARNFQTIMVTNFGVFTPIHETTNFNSYAGEAVSIFSFTPSTRLTFNGLRYPVENRSFSQLWEGTLNESLGNTFCIQLENEGEVLVYQAFQKENGIFSHTQ